MAALRHVSCVLGLLALVSFLAAEPAVAERTSEVTVFWGRNKEEGTLRETCDTGRYTTVIICFYSVFGHGRYWVDLSGHPLHGVGDDIKHCQSKNILVLLSIGGLGHQYFLPSSQFSKDVADNLFNAFLCGSHPAVFRPFGDTVLDGIDFFIETDWSGRYDELARHLYGYPKNKYCRILTATPRCAYPDWRIEKALQTGVFHHIHVRFYDDPECSYNHARLTGVMEQWDKWTARYSDMAIYLGLPAANLPGKDDMVSHRALYYDLLPHVQKKGNYGGVMLWNRYYDKQTNYSRNLTNWA